MTSWIPEQFARVGATLRLRSKAGQWTDGWKVVFVSKYRLDKDVLACNVHRHEQHRRIKQGLPAYQRDPLDSCW